MDDKLRELLKELGDAINDSISGSADVNDRIQRIRDEGYNLFVVLDATIGLGRSDEEEGDEVTTPTQQIHQTLALPGADTQFRINVNDLQFLRSVGIDPTRKVKSPRKS